MFAFFSPEHYRSTEVGLVGLQVWRGALLLSDLILAKPDHIRGKKTFELAAGTGLTSVVAATLAEKVVCTGEMTLFVHP